MLFYLASLQAISTEVYEAAAIDGAGAWRTFWKITFPLLKPGHFFVAVVSIIGALQQFDQSFIVGGTSGGPNYSTMTVVLYLYNRAFSAHFGYAAAVGLVLFVFIFTVTLDPTAPVREGRGGLMADERLPTTPEVLAVGELALEVEGRGRHAAGRRRHSRPRARRPDPDRSDLRGDVHRRRAVLHPVPLERLDLVQDDRRHGPGFLAACPGTGRLPATTTSSTSTTSAATR